jgi:hypothetical protein
MAELTLKHSFDSSGAHVHEVYDGDGGKVGTIAHDHFCRYATQFGYAGTKPGLISPGAKFAQRVDERRLELMHADSTLSPIDAMNRATSLVMRESPGLYQDWLGDVRSTKA